jgi:hypothetical protein
VRVPERHDAVPHLLADPDQPRMEHLSDVTERGVRGWLGRHDGLPGERVGQDGHGSDREPEQERGREDDRGGQEQAGRRQQVRVRPPPRPVRHRVI